MSLHDQIDLIRTNLDFKLKVATTEQHVEQLRIEFLGKKGSVSALLSTLGAMDAEERKGAGAQINLLKTDVAQAIEERATILKSAALDARLKAETVDITLPLQPAPTARGRIHPISQTIDEITAIFSDMGFSIAEGPDIETDYFNFTALNFPEGHPAREMHDTFFMKMGADGVKKVLRTHTSPVQVRVMQKTNEKPAASYITPAMDPPIRVVMPGRTYRNDSDQTHTPMFHQVEGLVIDKSSHIGQLRWVLEEFLKAYFEVPNVTLRFRPSFFPFTEPSMEVDVQCDRSGSEVKIGEGSDWLEILGCGMVHPNVVRNAGLDPDIYQGFAWGMGIDRIAMLKYGMPDLRAFFDGDQRWLDHYGFRPLDLPTLFGGLSS
ncbi:phenylalanine--tRNA ligase subunit beta [Devosia sp. Root436]|uniref:phenylalanine--tRNA ligase subunit alpha n=1 Tax=Devosia sp. Root436 TaxID=1736537 RepID=UPI0006FEDDDB|nr:phenylalanine--tRNA ligase subunit alpha [Devosia sp. Root436]KQX38561.1 phenylalanine--tRNA ligase subunit beta [Devosia sp. Root436]